MNTSRKGGVGDSPDLDKGKPVARRGRKAKGLSKTAWPPKVKVMRKLALPVVLAIAVLLGSAVPALAAVHVSAHAKAQMSHGRTQKVLFTARASRARTVNVTIYRNKKAVRTISAKGRGSTYAASWNLRTAAGRVAAAGSYAYRVRVRTKAGKTGSAGGSVVVNPPAAPGAAQSAGANRWIGVYMPGVPDSLSALDTLESQIGTRAAVVNFFISDSESFPAARVKNAHDHGSIPLVTLEFRKSVTAKGVDSILKGDSDQYLRTFANAAKADGGTIWLRPLHEMNGNWYPWAGVVGTNTSAKTVAAWKHIHDVFAAQGATNVKFVWTVNANSVPNTTANAMEKYWPGDAYVDYLAIDGYNWGGTSWSSASWIFGDAYRRVTALSHKPLFIAETGCNSVGGDKAAWITDFFSQMNARFPKIQGVCWFDVNKEHDWRLEQSTATLAAIRKIVSTGF